MYKVQNRAQRVGVKSDLKFKQLCNAVLDKDLFAKIKKQRNIGVVQY